MVPLQLQCPHSVIFQALLVQSLNVRATNPPQSSVSVDDAGSQNSSAGLKPVQASFLQVSS